MRYLEIKEALPSEQYVSDIKEVYRAIARIKQKNVILIFLFPLKNCNNGQMKKV